MLKHHRRECGKPFLVAQATQAAPILHFRELFDARGLARPASLKRPGKRFTRVLIFALIVGIVSAPRPSIVIGAEPQQDLLPKHVTAQAQRSVVNGLDFLARTQTPDGNWVNTRDTTAYPVSMAALAGMAFLANGSTTSRGPYADNVRRTVRYILGNQRDNGLIAGPAQEYGRPMYGHGFSLLFLATAYGMESDSRLREEMKTVIIKAIDLTARGQSAYGGWTYTPGAGDEGSVTITQMQALRAAQNAGFTVPKATVEEAVRYMERCRTPEGGIEYALGSGTGPRLPISAAALAAMYNAGEYDSPMAEACLAYVFKEFMRSKEQFHLGGHGFYAHLYGAQAFYQAGDKYWDEYFPNARDQIVQQQAQDGSWDGDGIGPIFGTSVALIILQLPYKFLPIYQR